jgi:hypothetical protein
MKENINQVAVLEETKFEKMKTNQVADIAGVLIYCCRIEITLA